MGPEASIKAALERNVTLIGARPSIGQGTAVTKVTLNPGLSCDVEDGSWRFTVGMTEKYGGQNNGPNPGVYGRAALGACLAIGYGMWAARLEIPVRALTVEVRARYDVRGEVFYDLAGFARMNEERVRAGEKAFENPRNAAAGTVRQLVPSAAASRPIFILTAPIPRLAQSLSCDCNRSIEYDVNPPLP